MDISIYNSARFSLIVQIIICVICSYGLTFKLKSEDMILNELLLLETVVQIIEFLFYILLVYRFSKLKSDVSVLRYYDWFLTTPTMLFTIIAFMVYTNQKNEKNQENEETEKEPLSVNKIFNEYRERIIKILLLNAAMLSFGVLGETNKMSRNNAFISGSIAFTYCFYLIYENFVNDLLLNKQVFWFNFIFWSLYGVAYTFSYRNQNISYNILDIFSKNLNGLLLFGYIYHLAK